MPDHAGLPVAGYAPQSDEKVQLANGFKQDEERLLRKVEALNARTDSDHGGYDHRFLAIAKTHFQEGFMALNRAVFQPQRIKLPEDAE